MLCDTTALSAIETLESMTDVAIHIVSICPLRPQELEALQSVAHGLIAPQPGCCVLDEMRRQLPHTAIHTAIPSRLHVDEELQAAEPESSWPLPKCAIDAVAGWRGPCEDSGASLHIVSNDPAVKDATVNLDALQRVLTILCTPTAIISCARLLQCHGRAAGMLRGRCRLVPAEEARSAQPTIVLWQKWTGAMELRYETGMQKRDRLESEPIDLFAPQTPAATRLSELLASAAGSPGIATWRIERIHSDQSGRAFTFSAGAGAGRVTRCFWLRSPKLKEAHAQLQAMQAAVASPLSLAQRAGISEAELARLALAAPAVMLLVQQTTAWQRHAKEQAERVPQPIRPPQQAKLPLQVAATSSKAGLEDRSSCAPQPAEPATEPAQGGKVTLTELARRLQRK